MLIFRDCKLYKDDEILALYSSVGWTNYVQRPELLEKSYNNSLYILGAYVDEKLVGIIRATGDGASIVFLQDLLVLPEYQRQGIGTKLMQAALARFADVYQLSLITEATEKNVAFYKSLGLINVEDFGCCAFIKQS